MLFPASQTGVLLSVLLIWAIVIGTAVIAARRDQRAPADDIGVLWLIVMATYATLPSLSWLSQGGYYDSDEIWRLRVLQPTEAEFLQLLDFALAYVVAFALAYLVLARNAPRAEVGSHARISLATMVAAIAIVVIVKVALLVTTAVGFIRSPTSYVDSYLAIQELPVGARQALKIASGFSAVAQVVVLVALLQRWPRYRGLFVAYILFVLLSFDPEGARVAAVTGLIAVAIAWHVLVRPIRSRWWIAVGLLGLSTFLALGTRRMGGSWEEFGLMPSGGVGEFDALWANALELTRARELGQLHLRDSVRFEELWAFVPSQFLPFEKASLSVWFVETFHPGYEARGGGWAFGAISQVVVGGGVPEALIRGTILGTLAAGLLRWYRNPRTGWWQLPLYLYLVSTVFQSVRDTTFRQITDLIQVALPALLVVALIARVLAGRGPPR